MDAERLLTAEGYGATPDEGHPTELIRGRVVAGSYTRMREGLICTEILGAFGDYLDLHDLGHPITGNVGIVTERNPDSVRSADFVYFSYDRIPKRPIPDDYPEVPPEFLVDVRAPDEPWADILAKATAFLAFGVKTACILDADTSRAYLLHANRPPQVLGPDDELTFPEDLPGFRVPVRDFFE